MPFPINRRELLRTVAAGTIAALPHAMAPGASMLHRKSEPGWVSGEMTGAEALVETLLCEGTDCIFGIPGAQDNEFWDTMKSRGLRYLLVTHEYSAAAMADGYARSTGRVGVLTTVPGPGVTNSLTGLGEALLDSIPVVSIVCDVARGEKYHPFQVHELPQVDLLKPVTKCVLAVSQAEEIPNTVRQAFALARSGEPGPVAVVVPYNLFITRARYHSGPLAPASIPCEEQTCARAIRWLSDRRCRVGIYAGLGCMDHAAALAQVAELLQAPVATSVSGKGTIPDGHPLAVGWGYGAQGTRTAEHVFKNVDVVLAMGVKFSEVSTAFYSLPPHQLIHVDANAQNLGCAIKADLCVHSDAGIFLARVLENSEELRRPTDGKLLGQIKSCRADDARHNQEIYGKCGVDPMALVLALRRCTQPDAQVFVDVTLTEHWAAEAFHICQPRTYFNPTDNQSMGWSIPAALGAQVAQPGRQIVTITGDGCFLMSAMEISTAARECLPVKFFILDDQAYHYMQKLQQQAYVRTTATVLARLDYAALAKGFGVAYQEITSCDELEGRIRGALQHPGPVLTRVVVDYDKRPVRWIGAVRKRYQDELTREQKIRFLARIGVRTLAHHPEND